MGEDSFETDNNVNIGADIGSNGQIAVRNGVTVNGAAKPAVGAPAPITGNGSTISGGTQYQASPWVLPFGDFAAASLSGASNNAALPAGYFRDAAKKHFYIGTTGTTYTMPAGDYHFCSFELERGVQLLLPTNGLVRIFVDHFSRPGSPCTTDPAITTHGRFLLDNSVDVNPIAGQPQNLEVYVHGTGNEAANTYRTCGGSSYQDDVIFCNSVTFKGVLIAGKSTVRMRNGATVTGGIASKAIDIKNGMTFVRSAAVESKLFNVPTAVTKRGWFECRTEPTDPADPESGCS